MALTEAKIRSLEPGTYSDGEGLTLDVRANGRKYWIARMWSHGKEIRRSLGPHPKVSLKEAREKNRALRLEGVRPRGSLFREIAEEFFIRRVEGHVSELYGQKQRLRLEKYILPAFGALPINELSSARVLELCRVIEDAGLHESAHRVKQLTGQICRYAIATGRAGNDPTTALRGALATPQGRHYSTYTEKEDICALMRSIDAYRYPLVRLAMFFSVYTFARPGEVRKAEWSEIVGEEWRLPAEKMKSRRMHIVPLSAPCLRVVNDLRILTGGKRYLFPSSRDDKRPMSENTVRCALRSMGLSIDPHGFRAMASTVFNEHGFPPDVIERQLAHDERDRVRAAYNHAQHLPERREMMAWWGEWVSGLL